MSCIDDGNRDNRWQELEFKACYVKERDKINSMGV